MISRRDKLLVKPWEQKRYENHRRKVQSAVPAIDVGPPKNRLHVFCKLKKQQKESERCDKIEKDNLKLLQKLRTLMTSKRVDNSWTKAQPNFLNRVTLYNTKARRVIPKKTESTLPTPEDQSRRGRCYACTPKKTILKIPEERIPWDSPKPTRSQRSRSLSSKRVQISATQSKEEPSPCKTSPRASSSTKLTQKPKPPIKISAESMPSIILKRGDLHLAVNFPSDTIVKLKDGCTEKFIVPPPCQCKAIRI